MGLFATFLKYNIPLSSLAGQTIVFVGDSITNGVGASSTPNRWTTLLCTAIGATENNQGANGRVLQAGTVCDGRPIFSTSLIPTYTNQGLLVIALGVNDILYNNSSFTFAGYKSAYIAAIDNAFSKGWDTKKILIVAPFYVTNYAANNGVCGCVTADVARAIAYRDVLEEVATLKQTLWIDPRKAFIDSGNPDAMLGDGIHPNDSGHLFVKNLLFNNPIFSK